MPALVLFGRRWQCATDDFVIPSMLSLLLRSLWLAAYAVVLWVVKLDDKCEKGHLFFKIYLAGAIGVYGVSILLDALMINASRKGSIMSSKQRTSVPIILYFFAALYLLEIGWASLGAYWVFGRGFNCDDVSSSALAALKGTVISNWVFIGLSSLSRGSFSIPLAGKRQHTMR
eukprot:Opistho-2@54293